MRKIIVSFVLLLITVFMVFVVFNHQNRYDFKLQSIEGEKTLKDFKGQNLIIYFGFTACADVCPGTLALLSNALEESKLKDRYKILFISLDPERDSIKIADEYAKYFYNNSIALIPTQKQLKKIAKAYGVYYEKIDLNDSVMKYSIAHSGSIFIFDSNGNFKTEVNNLTKDNVINAIIQNAK